MQWESYDEPYKGWMVNEQEDNLVRLQVPKEYRQTEKNWNFRIKVTAKGGYTHYALLNDDFEFFLKTRFIKLIKGESRIDGDGLD